MKCGELLTSREPVSFSSMEEVSITVVSENYCFVVTFGSFCNMKEVTLC
jgi:hypothetical protein